MSYTPEQRRTAVLSAAYGGKVADTHPISEFSVGDGVIVITNKGEPIMSGQIAEFAEYEGVINNVKLGDRWYSTEQHMFRPL